MTTKSDRVETSRATAADRDFCDQALPKVSRTFALSIQALPADLRDAVGIAYLLCRIVDTIEDDPKIRRAREELFDAFDAALAKRDIGEEDGAAVFERLSKEIDLGPSESERELVANATASFRVYRSLPEAQQVAIYPHVAEMSAGMREYAARADASDKGLRLRDLADLERYCYFVAGTVGGLLTSLFFGTISPDAGWSERAGTADTREAWLRDRAMSFGLGLQLVNIVKDIANDLERGDCFLPVELAEAHGLSSLEVLCEPASRARGLALVRAICARARVHLDRAVEYTLAWPGTEGHAVRLFCSVPLALAYATLREVEDGRDTLIPGRAPAVSRALVEAVFGDAIKSASHDEPLAQLFERCRVGAIGRCPRPSSPVSACPVASTAVPADRSAPNQTSPSPSLSSTDRSDTMQHDSSPAPRSGERAPDRNYTGKVFITGAAGHLGANLLHRLVVDGRDVRVLLRDGDNNEAVAAIERATGRRVERVMGDLRDLSFMRTALQGCETAFHVAAKVSTISNNPNDLRDLFESNVVGTANLLLAAREAGTARVVVSGSFSAVGYHEDDVSKAADETMRFYPFDEHLPYGRTKMQVEHEVLKAVAEGQDVVIATSCAILGPWDYLPSRMGRTLQDFTHGKLRAFVPGGFEFVAARDIVEGHLLAMKRGRTGQKYILSTEFMTVDDLMDIFEEVSGRPRPRLRLPGPMMAGIAEVTSFVLTNFFPKVPQRFTPGAVRILRMERHADITKAKTELGYQPTTIRAAIHEAYADFARRGLVPQSPTQESASARAASEAPNSRKTNEKGVAA